MTVAEILMGMRYFEHWRTFKSWERG